MDYEAESYDLDIDVRGVDVEPALCRCCLREAQDDAELCERCCICADCGYYMERGDACEVCEELRCDER